MNSILVLITSSPFTSANCHSALSFCEAACQSDCKVSVFFYGEGIHNANAFMSPVSDDKNLMHEWRSLSEKFPLQLIVCNTAANKRGVINEEEAKQNNGFNLTAPFIPGGLAEFASLSQSCDKLIQF